MTGGVAGHSFYPRALDSAGLARRQVRCALLTTGCPAREDAELAVTELVANACLHARGPLIRVSISHTGDGVRVEVADEGGSRSEPRLRPDGGPLARSGRGLHLVDAIAAEWGHTGTAPGPRTVWARIACKHP